MQPRLMSRCRGTSKIDEGINVAGTTEHELSSLEPDNLLAFLALLGLLRSLETAKPDWHPRVKWRGLPLSATLVIDREITSDQLAFEIDVGVKQIGQSYAVLDGHDNIKFTAEEFRTLFQKTRTDRIQSQIVCVLASDGAIKKNGKEIAPTAFCAMFGSGHQHFLTRLRSVPCDGTADDIHSALFEPWQYSDDTSSFRWDPIEDRRYALQFGDPSKSENKVGTVTGANRLAAIGFGTLVSVPTAQGLATLGIVDKDKQKYACWPIPTVPTSLTVYLALLAHPALANPKESSQLVAYGISAIAQAERFQVDRYFNFARARMQFLS